MVIGRSSKIVTLPEGYGPILRRLREERGVSVEVLAEQIQLPVAVLVAIESGASGMILSEETLRDIALILGSKYGKPRERLGTIVRRLRLGQKLSLAELSEQTGISVMQISRIEQLKSSPTEGSIRRIAAALGVPVAVLFGEEPFLSVIGRVEMLLSQVQSKLIDARQELRREDIE